MSQNATTLPTRRSRSLVLTGAVSVALISTGSAYLAMVQFGIDVLAMNQGTAYATAGVFELSLVTVALLAREAARDNRPGGILLTLTWALSSASGLFAAWHEAYIGHPIGAVVFRFVVPLLAALMWHLALIGDRHLATGTSWSAMRQSARMHALFLSTEDLFRAQSLHDGSRAARRRLARAEAGRRRARSVALRTVPPMEMRAQVAAWCEALAAVGDGTADVARLHLADRQRLAGVADDLDAELTLERAATNATIRDLTNTAGMDGDVSTLSRETKATGPGGDSVHGESLVAVSRAGVDAMAESTETRSRVSAAVVDRSTETVHETIRGGDRGRRGRPATSTNRPSTASTSTRGLSPEVLDEIAERAAAGAKAEEIAEELGLGRSTVYKKLKIIQTPGYGIPRVDNPSPLSSTSTSAESGDESAGESRETAGWAVETPVPSAVSLSERPRAVDTRDEVVREGHGDTDAQRLAYRGSLVGTSGV